MIVDWGIGAGAVDPVDWMVLSAVGSGAEGSRGCCEAEGFGSGVEMMVAVSPKFMLFHSASTSIVAPEAVASGFLFSCSLSRSLAC